MQLWSETPGKQIDLYQAEITMTFFLSTPKNIHLSELIYFLYLTVFSI